MIAVAMLALVLAGGLSYGLALLFFMVMVLGWNLEGTRWQVPEKIGLVVVLVSIPLFYLDWQYQKSIGEPVERLGVNALAHLIVFLSAVKLLQVKKDRDWVFLYLILRIIPDLKGFDRQHLRLSAGWCDSPTLSL